MLSLLEYLLLFGRKLTCRSLVAISIIILKHIHKLIQNLLFLGIHAHIHLLVILLQSLLFVSSFKIQYLLLASFLAEG